MTVKVLHFLDTDRIFSTQPASFLIELVDFGLHGNNKEFI